MRVLIVGCGYIGLALGRELRRLGHEVWGLRRSKAFLPELAQAGITGLTADVTVPESLARIDARYDWVVHCVSASGGGPREYEAAYVTGTRNLLLWLKDAAPKSLVYTSSTGVYGQNDGAVVDETSPTLPDSPTGKVLVEGEKTLLETSRALKIPAVVLRVAGIYGPGRTYWLEQIRSGNARLEQGGNRILNMIHCEDIVGAILTSLANGMPGRAYNAVDDEPVAQAVFFDWLSTRLGSRISPQPASESSLTRKRGATNKRVSNVRLKGELGYKFTFPTFREGYESILSSSCPEVC